MKTAIYVRVSMQDQDISMQEREISLFLKNKGITEYQIYKDEGHTGKNETRPEFKRLKNDIKGGAIQLLVVYKLDRLSRSLKDLLGFLELIKENSTDFISLKDSFDLTTSAGKLMMQMLGAFAEFERNIIVERTISGLANAKAKGVQLGRPIKVGNFIKDQVRELRSQGLTYKDISNITKVSTATICSILSK